MPRPISATISLPALRHNLDCIRGHMRRAGQELGRRPPLVWAVIKANAYGHGIEQARRAFDGADGLAMLDLDEAVRCREAGWQGPIMLLEGFFQASDIRVLQDYRLSTVLHCREQLDMLDAVRGGAPLPAWVKLNTGMNRLGFSLDAFGAAHDWALQALRQGRLASVGMMMHFARADDDAGFTRVQLERFQQAVAGRPGAVSVCNSAASLLPECWASFSPDTEQWARVGICLYGASPFPDRSAAALGLLPAMTLRAQIIGVQRIRKGEGVGYGHAFVADKDMRVGVVACGYADGYPRHAPNGTPITVMGVRTRVVGRVSMDMLIVDIDGIPDAGVGAPVVLWGEGGPGVDEVARACGTIGYELLCAVAPRVPRTIAPLAGASQPTARDKDFLPPGRAQGKKRPPGGQQAEGAAWGHFLGEPT